MKKIVLIFLMGVIIASCAKKMAPATSQAPSGSNNGVAASSNVPSAANEPKMATASPSAAAATPTPTATDATAQAAKPTRATGELTMEQKGQSTYNAKCGRCHGLKVTTDYTVDRWLTVMQVMAIKANLNDEEKQNVVAYVKANAKK
jgi:mono/diheme cytochrome c family protein